MKLPAFEYVRAQTPEQVLAVFEQADADVQILAGGQSLIAALNFRLSEPSVLVDINRLPNWDQIENLGEIIRIGALVRHRQLLESAVVKTHLPLISEAIVQVAHPAIRNRGTIGGSLALADPAAELPACALACGATIVTLGKDGERRISAQDFFLGLYETALQAGELIRAIEFPQHGGDGAWHFFDEVTRRQGDYAMAGVAICRAPGQSPSIAWFGISDRPIRGAAAEAALMQADAATIDLTVWREAATEGIDVFGDIHASEKMKKHLAAVLLKRAATSLNRQEAA